MKMNTKKRFNIIYYWYDHLILRDTGEAALVQAAIEQHDYEAFCKFCQKYPKTRSGNIFFPKTALIWDNKKHDFVGEVDITTPEGFSKIDSSDYECG